MDPSSTLPFWLLAAGGLSSLAALAASLTALHRSRGLDPSEIKARVARIVSEYETALTHHQATLAKHHQQIQAYYARLSKLEQDLLGPPPPADPPDAGRDEDDAAGAVDPKEQAIADARRLGVV